MAYLTRRSHDIDYSTLRDIAADLCGKFWTGVRKVNPAQADLALAPEDYESWRAVLEVRGDGQPRLSTGAVLTTIRAFYLDIQGWAAQEPERWARWVVPCSIGSRETRSQANTKRRAKERMDGRIRLLQPLLPAFVAAVTVRRDHLHDLLNAATDAEPDQVLTVGAKNYRRLFTVGDARHAERHGHANIRVLDESTGQKLNVTFAEEGRSGSGQPLRPCGTPGCVARNFCSYPN